MKNQNILFATIMITALMLTTPPVQAELSAPQLITQKFQNSLIDVMKAANNTTVQQRFDALKGIISRSFHIPLMAQISAGKNWKAATRAEKRNYTEAFHRMSIATLATLFDGYSGETFEQIDDKPGPQKTRLIVTQLVKNDKSTVKISYIMRQFTNGWRIIDVILDDGISELMIRRSEYRQVLKKSGLKGLTTLLTNKADELLSGQ